MSTGPALVPPLDIAEEAQHIIRERERGWRDSPPDPPTNWGITLPQWDEWCRATQQTWRTGKRQLRISTEEDAISFYRWYFTTQGLAELIREFAIPRGLIPLVMDMRTQHSPEGCRKILAFARDIPAEDVEKVKITLARTRYLLWLAEKPQKHLRRDVRGIANRMLNAIGWWPLPSEGDWPDPPFTDPTTTT